MFKKFDVDSDITSQIQVKQSVQKAIRSNLRDQYPLLTPYIDDILPKKEPVNLIKGKDHVEIVACRKEPLFFRKRDSTYLPTLKLLHKFPFLLPKFQVDAGAIKFILSGANVMAPGLNSRGGRMDEVDKDTIVGIYAEGKQHSMGIGQTLASTKEIQTVNKGIAIELIHYLNDGLWQLEDVRY
ncbi:Malignant T-cell-amplified sequence 1-like [Oopsacas minuta]|uniref:Malignant T-cell-amplified sequence 1-like n=1 Tax=Oopsacas minuta TaxID=111878 RepID=A0AAV7K1I1_9METZ|nr:Malignant T-cell-amplified sequence 1-like [Oopsacas minuta]